MIVIWETLAPIAALTLLALLAVRFGHDSRDSPGDPPRPAVGSPVAKSGRGC
jgi:hypothetical protein